MIPIGYNENQLETEEFEFSDFYSTTLVKLIMSIGLIFVLMVVLSVYIYVFLTISLIGGMSVIIFLIIKGLKEINPDIYRVVKNIDTSFKIGPNEANCLKHAARILVESEVKKLRENNSWSTLVQDPPGEAYSIEPCKQEENNQ